MGGDRRQAPERRLAGERPEDSDSADASPGWWGAVSKALAADRFAKAVYAGQRNEVGLQSLTGHSG
jgi:hypothetical protein